MRFVTASAGRVSDVDPTDLDYLTKLGAVLANGWGEAAFFALTGYGGMVFLFRLLVREQREHLADVRAVKAEYREANPVLRELGDTLAAVRHSAKQPDESPLLRRMEVLLEAVEADRRSRRP